MLAYLAISDSEHTLEHDMVHDLQSLSGCLIFGIQNLRILGHLIRQKHTQIASCVTFDGAFCLHLYCTL